MCHFSKNKPDSLKIGGKLFTDVLRHPILLEEMKDRMKAADTLFEIASGIRVKGDQMAAILIEILKHKLDEPTVKTCCI